MPFPDAARAVVTKEKVCDYLLNLAHPIGGPKAVWFRSLGYTLEDWESLARDLVQVATACESFVCKPSPYGVKYETAGQIAVPPHPSGRVVAVWIVEANSLPRLVTAYPG
jgi:hypothetical protein